MTNHHNQACPNDSLVLIQYTTELKGTCCEHTLKLLAQKTQQKFFWTKAAQVPFIEGTIIIV